jgi:hypothetical protein
MNAHTKSRPAAGVRLPAIEETPEIFGVLLPVLVWIPITLLNIPYFLGTQSPAPWRSWLLILAILGAYCMGFLLARHLWKDGASKLFPPTDLTRKAYFGSIITCSLISLAACWIYFGLRFESADALKDVRSMHRDYGFAADAGWRTIAYALLYPTGFSALYLALWRRPSWPVALVLLISLVVGFALVARTTGGRMNLQTSLSLMVSALFILYGRKLLKNWLRVGLFAFLGLIIALGGNTIYNAVRGYHGIDTLYRDESVLLGERVLAVFGITSVPLWIAAPFSALVLYVALPISMLEHFLMRNDQSLMYGTYQFASVGARLKTWSDLPDRTTMKFDVDAMYNEIGFRENVWATALRESILDFGVLGTVLQWFFLGVIISLLWKAASRNMFAGFFCAVLGAYIVQSPMTNALLNRTFESSVLLGGVACFLSIALRPSGPRF